MIQLRIWTFSNVSFVVIFFLISHANTVGCIVKSGLDLIKSVYKMSRDLFQGICVFDGERKTLKLIQCEIVVGL